MTAPRERLARREIALLKLLAQRGGGRPVTIERHLQRVAASLWRRDLVEIWYLQAKGESLRGPFHALTMAGWRLASSFLDASADVAPAQTPARSKRPEMQIRNYDPTKPGQGFQGDVSIIPIPHDLAVATVDEIKPDKGVLVLQQGEATGHHHAIYLLTNIPRYHDEAMARAMPTDMFVNPRGATAKLYRDPTVAPELVRRGILTRSDLATSCLIVEGGTMVVYHEEHDGVRLPPGKYLIGSQVESVGAEERVVRD